MPRSAFVNAIRTSDLYSTSEWKKARLAFLLGKRCTQCARQATIVDHEPPHRGDVTAFWDRATWQPLCFHHHQVKTGQEIARRRDPRREPEPHPGMVR